MKKIVLAGGGGNLGHLLIRSFLAQGYYVVVLTRQHRPSPQDDVRYVKWDALTLGDWVSSLEGTDVLINLCGESIAKRLTPHNKDLLLQSRIIPTTLLGDAIKELDNPPSRWINFSGISIFEDVQGSHDEYSEAFGSSFLAELVQQWEAAFRSTDLTNVHKTIVRISPVLSRNAGMFAQLYPLVKYGLGGQVGDGRQYISWIHEHDFVKLINWMITIDQPKPLYHACSPHPMPNSEFMQKFRAAAGVTFGLPLPTIGAKVGAWIKGVDASLLLGSVNATSSVAADEGFEFDFHHLETALDDLIKTSQK